MDRRLRPLLTVSLILALAALVGVPTRSGWMFLVVLLAWGTVRGLEAFAARTSRSGSA